MKVKIGPYKNHWVSPYKIVEKIVFWKDWENYDAPWVEKVTDILHYPCVAINETLDYLFPRKVKVRIDPWDTWSMDYTLAHIIHPMLVQLKENNPGAGRVDDEDVPDHLKSTAVKPKKNEWDTDDNYFKRWDYVMDEMIWAFESIIKSEEYQDSFFIQKGEGLRFEEVKPADGKPAYTTIKYDVPPIYDYEKEKVHMERQRRGLMFFGKYYFSLWE